MKKIILALAVGFIAFANSSCSSDDNTRESVITESKFKGVWGGTYSGEASGNWTATINENGEFIGQASNPSNPTVFTMKGTIRDSGELDADFYVNNSVVGEFNGTLSSSSCQGNWTNTVLSLSGTWQGTKNLN